MIREFRLVVEGNTRDSVIDDASSLASRIIRVAHEAGQIGDEWECTDDVVNKSSKGYVARMKFKYRGEE